MHREVALQPLSLVLADFTAMRNTTYDAYRRRLGADAVHLPDRLAAVVTAVTAFADPALTGSLPHESIWRAASRAWRHPGSHG